MSNVCCLASFHYLSSQYLIPQAAQAQAFNSNTIHTWGWVGWQLIKCWITVGVVSYHN